jgi:peroxiredoxin
LILVDLGEDTQKVGNFLARRGLSFDMILFDSDGAVANDYGVQGVPTYIFIGRNGVVKAVDHRLLRDYERILLGEE